MHTVYGRGLHPVVGNPQRRHYSVRIIRSVDEITGGWWAKYRYNLEEIL